MKNTKKTFTRVRRIAALSICTGCLLSGTTAMAAISYSYENDNKTLVVTVDSGANWLQDDEYQAALNANNVTNLVKRGAGTFGVNGTARNFAGDVYIEEGSVQLQASTPLGTSGKIYVNNQRSVILSSGASVAKDIVLVGSYDSWERESTSKLVSWAMDAKTTGKVLLGKKSGVNFRTYSNSKLTFSGGVEDWDSANSARPFFQASGGGGFIFENKPLNIGFNFYPYTVASSSYPLSADGFAERIVFAAAGNKMAQFGHDSYRLNWCELKTTVDWAFNKEIGTMYIGHDSVWDLCGTSQRIAQMDVKVTTGKPTVITNSFERMATLHLGKPYGPSDAPPDIRFGGNLSVVFEQNIWTTKIDHEMTATGNLIVEGNGGGGATSAILQFTENGTWANATNVVVEGVGKIKIANSNALGRKANVNLAANSSLEIDSGLTVCVKTLTVGGVQKPAGNYTFGSGTLSVSHPRGFVLSIY